MRQIAIILLICMLVTSAMHQLAAEEDAPLYQPENRPLSDAELIEYSAKLEAMIVHGWETKVDRHKADYADVIAAILGVTKEQVNTAIMPEGEETKNPTYKYINMLVCSVAAACRHQINKEDGIAALFLLNDINRIFDIMNTPFLDKERGEYFARARELLIRPEYMIPLETEIIRRSEALPIGEGAIEERISQWAALFNDDPIQDGALMHWLFTEVRGEEITEPYEGIIDRCKYNRLEFTTKYTRQSILALELAQKPRSILNARLMVHLWPTLEKYSVRYYSARMVSQIIIEASMANYATFVGAHSNRIWDIILPLFLNNTYEQLFCIERIYLKPFVLNEKIQFETGPCWFATDLLVNGKDEIVTDHCTLFPIIQVQIPKVRKDAMTSYMMFLRNCHQFREVLLGVSDYFNSDIVLESKLISITPCENSIVNIDIDIKCSRDIIEKIVRSNPYLFKQGLGNFNPHAITANNYLEYMIPRIFVHYQKTTTKISALQEVDEESGYALHERSVCCYTISPEKDSVCDKVMIGFVFKKYNDYPGLCGELKREDAMIWNAYEFVKDTNNEFLLNEFKKIEVQLVDTSIERWNERCKKIERLRNGEEW